LASVYSILQEDGNSSPSGKKLPKKQSVGVYF